MSTIDRDELDIKDPPIFVYADYGRRKTKEEKNTSAVSLNVLYAKKM